jgi:putative transcriptional regulator
MPERTEEMFARAIRAKVRNRIMAGKIESGEDIAELRRFVDMTEEAFAEGIGVSVSTLRCWEQGQRGPRGAAIALLRIVARRPGILDENLPLEKRGKARRISPEEIAADIGAIKAKAGKKRRRRAGSRPGRAA